MKYLGLDVGSKTIGLATGQGIISLSKTTINFPEYNFSQAINLILQFIKQENPDIIIVGHPLNMNGSKSKTTIMVEDFVLQLKTKTNCEIILWDERLTSRSANQIMLTANVSRKKRKMNKDKLAAQLILQNYFDYLKHLGTHKVLLGGKRFK